MVPAQTEQARARLNSARRQLQLVSDQIAAARVTATRGGRVVYLPLHIGGEFRTVREGDTVFRNQEFMRISDMEQLVVRCDVPESRLSRVPAGAEVLAVPDAFPELRLEGQVLSISSVAVQPAGRPAHMKTFTVTMLLFDADPRLRTGMTVRARVLSERHPQSPVVPRPFVRFEAGTPYVFVRRGDGEDRVAVTLGSGNETHFMIVEGVEAGTVLVRPPAL
ncbi:MAG: efflux RND transporter periplasmic adaptor subunit [Kiritimatiellae bacterium]|nr:efflux RND transporter periplasmic adaptor subunit [Kiritimatiellia bacterium]